MIYISKKNEVLWNYVYENKNVLQNETLAISVPFWVVCNSKLGKLGRRGKASVGRTKDVLWEVHRSTIGSPSAGVLHQDSRTYPV